MPDEATVDYTDLIETMTLGHQFILDAFGVRPRYGFQVDPFGASSTFAAFSAKMGFDAHVLARINYFDKGWMQRERQLEFLWRPSEDAAAGAGQADETSSHSSSAPPRGSTPPLRRRMTRSALSRLMELTQLRCTLL